jgi:imidazole glycerol-phosphate synthase subunit HisH
MAGIVIVDYGMANLRSVQKAFERVGAAAEITSDPGAVAAADKLVLPGVGAFRDAIARLREAGLAGPVVSHIDAGRPFLGICLGLQLLFTRSHEDGVHDGLNVLRGEVVRFPKVPGLKVPHMGWNHLRLRDDCPLFRGLPPESAVYFVHSYYAAPVEPGLTSATADYPEPFTAAVWRDNLFATQFHPEKSQAVGLTMLKNFTRL